MVKPTAEQIGEHYEIEKRIADRLRRSSIEERRTLYTQAYDELFRALPHHPMLTPKPAGETDGYVEKELLSLTPLIDRNTVFAEIGPGNCALSIAVAGCVSRVYAIDVSNEITRHIAAPANFDLIVSDGMSIPLDAASVDLIYSNQLMEHLHPDDALAQLVNVQRALRRGGHYYCVTPNRLSGPHDISRDFDAVATGLHLREYTVSELDRLLRQSGFISTRILFRVGRKVMFLPLLPFKIVEAFLKVLPDGLRKFVTFNRVVRYLLGIKILAKK